MSTAQRFLAFAFVLVFAAPVGGQGLGLGGALQSVGAQTGAAGQSAFGASAFSAGPQAGVMGQGAFGAGAFGAGTQAGAAGQGAFGAGTFGAGTQAGAAGQGAFGAGSLGAGGGAGAWSDGRLAAPGVSWRSDAGAGATGGGRVLGPDARAAGRVWSSVEGDASVVGSGSGLQSRQDISGSAGIVNRAMLPGRGNASFSGEAGVAGSSRLDVPRGVVDGQAAGSAQASTVLLTDRLRRMQAQDPVGFQAFMDSHAGLKWRFQGVRPGERTGWTVSHAAEAAANAELDGLWHQRADLMASGASASQVAEVDARIAAIRSSGANGPRGQRVAAEARGRAEAAGRLGNAGAAGSAMTQAAADTSLGGE